MVKTGDDLDIRFPAAPPVPLSKQEAMQAAGMADFDPHKPLILKFGASGQGAEADTSSPSVPSYSVLEREVNQLKEKADKLQSVKPLDRKTVIVPRQGSVRSIPAATAASASDTKLVSSLAVHRGQEEAERQVSSGSALALAGAVTQSLRCVEMEDTGNEGIRKLKEGHCAPSMLDSRTIT